MKKNKYGVFLRILEFEFDPDEITSYTGLKPSKIWRKGDLIHPKAKTEIIKDNGWEISSSLDKNHDFDLHVDDLINKVKPCLNKLIEISKENYVELSCVLYLYYNEEEERHPTPSISFSNETIEILNKLNANIDIDLYVL